MAKRIQGAAFYEYFKNAVIYYSKIYGLQEMLKVFESSFGFPCRSYAF